ncbi:glycoside hydrolase [Ceratobasidium sp. AG-I]|nr:glycoside hydrolase [Ceratobasidium sp. AG-I]
MSRFFLSCGVFPGPTWPSAYDLLKRNAFVTRKDTSLYLLGKEFRIVGPNIYWLGLDENVVPNPSYPARTRVLEVMADVLVMRGTVIRGHTLGISVGTPLSVEPSLNQWNDKAYEAIDFAILAARLYGIKLLIPLTDNFIQWAGIPFSGLGADITPPDVGAFFYNNTVIVASVKTYITRHLNHVNQYTGIALKDDPTILGWETGNELSAVRFGDGPAPAKWTKEIAQLVKKLAPKHLVSIPRAVEQRFARRNLPGTDQLDVAEVDYPRNITKNTVGRDVVHAKNRNYFHGGDDLQSFLDAIKAGKSVGSHNSDCCSYVEHNDGFSFYYPGRTADMQARAKALTKHAADLNGATAPNILPAIACPQYNFPASLFPGNTTKFWNEAVKSFS